MARAVLAKCQAALVPDHLRVPWADHMESFWRSAEQCTFCHFSFPAALDETINVCSSHNCSPSLRGVLMCLPTSGVGLACSVHVCVGL